VVLDDGRRLEIKRPSGPAARPHPTSGEGHAGPPPAGAWGPYREGSRSPELGDPVVHSPPTPTPTAPTSGAAASVPRAPTTGATARVPLGAVFGARSGDKGGNANLGVWARDEHGYGFLVEFLTVEKLRELIPEARDLQVHRYELPNLLAVNFVVVGLLGEGVSSSTRVDPQAKGLGEWLRARVVELPVELLERQGG
jgi:hypothetical protein